MSTATVEAPTPIKRRRVIIEETPYSRDVAAYSATGAGWMAVLAYRARYRLAQGWASLKAAGRWILANLDEAAHWTVTQLRRAGRWLLAAAARARTAIATAAVAVWSNVTATADYLWAKALGSATFLKAKAIAGSGAMANWLAVPVKFVFGGAAALGAMLMVGGQSVLLLTIGAATVLVLADRVMPVPEGRLSRLKKRTRQAVVNEEPVQLDYNDAQAAMQMMEVEHRVNELAKELSDAHETDNIVKISELAGRHYVAQSRMIGSADSVSALWRQFYAEHTNIYGESVNQMFDWDAVRDGMKLESRFLASVQTVPSQDFAEKLMADALRKMEDDAKPKRKTTAKKTTAKKAGAKTAKKAVNHK